MGGGGRACLALRSCLLGRIEDWLDLREAREAVPKRSHQAAHRLSQSQPARQLRLKQPAVARLERGEHPPTIDTLRLFSGALNTGFLLAITPDRLGRRRPRWLTKHITAADAFEEVSEESDSRVLVSAS
jgi:transcriptional regulator with XRE-family HTH domain